MCREALKVAQRNDERKLVLQVLTRCPSSEAIGLAGEFLKDAELRPQAAESLVVIGEKMRANNPTAAAVAGQLVLSTEPGDQLIQRAKVLVKPN